MKNERNLLFLAAIAAYLLVFSSSAADWLEGGYAGPIDRSEILPYFSDPIFYMPIPSTSYGYYPYTAWQYFNYTRPNMVYLGRYPYYAGSWGTYPWGIYPGGPYPPNEEPRKSEFRQSSLAGMEWTPFQKNWGRTVSYAQNYSSLRVNQGGYWRTAV